jgi:CRISPR-associated protein Cmr2
MSDEKQYMLLFSLGPVQSFIAQARKTRDLMLGSFLLSMLMEAAMKGLDDKLVYPADPTIKNDVSDLPNKFVALFDNYKDARNVADESEKRIKELWDAIREDVWEETIKKATTPGNEKVTKDIWDQQSDPGRFFEIFWVIAEGSPAQYTQWLREAQEALDARKRFRNFEQQDEEGEKSTISGEREALRSFGQSRNEVKEFWAKVVRNAQLSTKDISSDGSERLDAIDTIKRFALSSPKVEEKLSDRAFPSTSMVAAASFIESLLTEALDHDALESWRSATKGKFVMAARTEGALPYLQQLASSRQAGEYMWLLRRDGDLYFPETFTAKRLEEDYGFAKNAAPGAVTQGLLALKRLLDVTGALHIPHPTPYYAFIQMDGDKMGTILGDVEDKDEHKKVSEALSSFSRYVPEIVRDQYPGRIAYSGGDDVVALAPLARNIPQKAPGIKTVLDLVDELRQAYSKTVSAPLKKVENQKKVTASTGIAIAHHLTSLSYVRRVAKEAESSAKNHYGRNALVVTVLRRSGEQTRVGCRWHYDKLSDKGQPIPLFTEFYYLFKQDFLSPKCVYILLEEAHGLARLEPGAQASEIRRVLLRQRRSKEDISDDRVRELSQQLADLAKQMDEDKKPLLRKGQEPSTELHAEGRRYGLVEVLGWLLVTVFLARKEQE